MSVLAAAAGGAFLPAGMLGALPPAAVAALDLVDVHHHIWPPAYMNKARNRVVAQAQGYLPARVLEWTPERSIAEMDRGGAATSIVSISTPGVWFGKAEDARVLARQCNEYAARLASDYPGRFGFFAAIPLPDAEGSLREIAYAFDVLRADGIGLMTSYDDKWPGDRAFAPVFDELNRRKAVVYLHPTAPACCRDLIPNVPQSTTEYPHDTTRAVTSLLFSGSFTRLPDIRFIVSHGGGTVPMLAARIARRTVVKELADRVPKGVEYELRRLYYEIVTDQPGFAALKSLVPSSQILFGSDYPYGEVDATAREMRNLGLSPSDLQAIARGNALAMFARIRT